MSNSIESGIIQKFRDRLNRGNLDDIHVTYRVAGGMPAEDPIEAELSVSGNLATARSLTSANESQSASAEFESVAVQNLLEQVDHGIGSLLPRSEARFLPDSVVGSITLEVDGEQATFYFLANEDDRLNQNQPISPAMVEAISTFSQISQQLLQQGGH